MYCRLREFKRVINKTTTHLLSRNPSHVHSTLCLVKNSVNDVSPKMAMNIIDNSSSYKIKQYLGNNKEHYFEVKSKDVTKIHNNPFKRFVLI